MRSGTHPFDVVALTADSSGVYAAGTGNGGTVIKFGSTGNMIFQGGVDGNAVGVAVMDGMVYVPGHFNVYCGRVMGFNNCPATGVGAATRDKLLALDSTTGALQSWHPAANSSLGTFTIAAGSGYVATGGDYEARRGIATGLRNVQGVGFDRGGAVTPNTQPILEDDDVAMHRVPRMWRLGCRRRLLWLAAAVAVVVCAVTAVLASVSSEGAEQRPCRARPAFTRSGT